MFASLTPIRGESCKHRQSVRVLFHEQRPNLIKRRLAKEVLWKRLKLEP